ncbi:hypothetical protein [Enterococcus rotai]|uniref:hypothetical protein n=1 Tax=Enterococcus rotai TaxID=118060 RepID=UPI0032B58E80
MKVITVCGSLKFKDEMMKIGMQLELAGNAVLLPIFPVNEETATFTEEELAILGRMHIEKIKLSDAIVVINVNNYIGNSTKYEIEFAQSLKKEILYYTDLMKDFAMN